MALIGTDPDNPLAAPTADVNPFSMQGGAGYSPYAVAPTTAQPPALAPAPAGPQSVVAPDFAASIAKMESGGKANAENPYWPAAKGGPLGPNQFIASTWQAFAAANPQYFQGMTPDQILAARADPRLSALATNWYASYNAQHLAQSGIQPSPQNLAIAHALGGGGAASALKYPDTTPLAQIFKETQPGAADAILRMNPQYQKMTLGDLKAKYAGLGTTPMGQPPPASAPLAQIVPGVSNMALTSLAPYASAANVQASPLQRLAQLQQLRSMFAPQQAQQPRQQVAQQMPMVGGVNANIPLGVV